MGFAKRMLVLAPLKVCQATWPLEVRKWAQFQHLKIKLAHGPNKVDILNDQSLDIVLLNYDGIAWAAPLLAKHNAFEVLACDELTALKNTNSKRFKTLKPILPSFKFRWGLTGTPAANGFIDLFGQIYVLDLGKRLGKYITHFRNRYFYQKPWDQYRYYITEQKMQELVHAIEDLVMYIDPEEWLELPPFVPVVRPVPMEPRLRAQYKVLEQEMILKIQNEVITVTSAGVLTMKLRQFTGGAIYGEDRQVIKVHDAKLDALEDLVEELAGEPLMVAYSTEHEYIRIKERFPDALVLKGGMSSKDTESVVQAWNSGNARLLLVQPAAASKGLNLQFGGNAICWYTLTYNFEDYEQLNKRLHRSGQTRPVFCYLLSMEGTIDEDVARILADKNANQEKLFEPLKCKTL